MPLKHEFGAGRRRKSLLSPILRRMRKLLLIFLKPNTIAHVDKAAAERAAGLAPRLRCLDRHATTWVFRNETMRACKRALPGVTFISTL